MDDRSLSSFNHGDALLTYFQQLQQQQRFADVTVQCDGDFVASCHRLVLASFSTHFETALANVEGSSTITLDIDPKITGVSANDLKNIVDFMYHGRVEVIGSLLGSARSLGCISLMQLIQVDDVSASDSMVEDNSHAQKLLDACRRFYMDNRFTDVSINCQGMPLTSCHRLILCAYSDHFEAALASTEHCPLVTLDIDSAITGVTSLDLRTMIDFMYSGVVRIPKRRLKSLTAAARALGVSKLMEVLVVGDPQRSINQTVNSTVNYGSSVAASVERLPSVSQSESLESSAQTQSVEFDVNEVGATEDVGCTTVDEAGNEIGMLLADGAYAAEVTAGRELTATDDYVEIYEEFVSGPRRGRKGGTYGRKHESLRIKGPAKGDTSLLSGDLSLASSLGLGTSDNVDDDNNCFDAVTMSYTSSGKRRRLTDSFGYGLPEIIGTNDVTVPLLVGDQQMMMEKPFKCPYCDHRTKEKSAVEKHIRCIHTLEAPYKCRYCNQAFKVQSNLVRHIRAHTGEKPYVCKKCGAAYADKKNMDAHVFREHLKMKPLECPSVGCTAKFWRQDRFNYHCRRQHSYEP